MSLQVLLVLACLAGAAMADLYMHNPRGCTDRLNEANTNRNNDNRLFDSQDNAKGGYCWGPPMYYYTGSQLSVEWTAQHSCNTENSHCQLIIQYMCGDEIRDGATTDTIPDDPNTYNTMVPPPKSFADAGVTGQMYLYGMNEDYQYYQDCKVRQRNRGLFIADRALGGDTAIFTRQNNNGDRHGFECTEERDYYPYWHPSPWKDVAILTDRTDMCGYYRSESQNVKSKNFCQGRPQFNTQASCQTATNPPGVWTNQGSWGMGAPDCLAAPWSRDNHLGNGGGSSASTFLQGLSNTYNWTVPNTPAKACILRMRYNISTDDYDDRNTFANSNGAASPVKQNPYVYYMGGQLRLALNTNQYGRTFQDRSYTFEIRSRPSNIPDFARIFNLNVRGKRGNIVQVYPAVEYDFVPNVLNAKSGDYIHFQWTGCDTNPAGNDGEGTQQTDRSNIVELNAQGINYPLDNSSSLLDDGLKYQLAYLNQKNCSSIDDLNNRNNNDQNQVNQDRQNCFKLNSAAQYFDGGLQQASKTGTFRYMSTRNNNYTNRSQKGIITIDLLLPVWAIVLVCFGAVAFIGAAAVAGGVLYSRKNPQSNVAAFFNRF